MSPIFAFSTRVGPPPATTTFWFKTTPSTSSVSSIVPPTFFTIRTSLRSTFDDVEVAIRVTASTAIGARVDEYCDTIYQVTISDYINLHNFGYSKPLSSKMSKLPSRGLPYRLNSLASKSLSGTRPILLPPLQMTRR